MSCVFYINEQTIDQNMFAQHARSLFTSGKFTLVRGYEDEDDFFEEEPPSFTYEKRGMYLVKGGSRGVALERSEDGLSIILTVLTTYIEWQFATEILRCALLSGATCKTEEDQPILIDHLTDEFTRGWFDNYWKLGKNSMISIINQGGTGECPCNGYSLSVDQALMALDDDAIQAQLANSAYKYASAYQAMIMTIDQGLGPQALSVYSRIPTLISKEVDFVKVMLGEPTNADLVPIDQFLKVAEKHVEVTRMSENFFVNELSEANTPAFMQDIQAVLNSLPIPSGLPTPSGNSTTQEGTGGVEQAAELAMMTPLYVFCLVAAADGNIDRKEIKVFTNILNSSERMNSSTLFAAALKLCTINPQQKIKQILQSDIIEDLKKIRVYLDTQVEPAQAIIFKLAMISIGYKIAEASGTGLMSKLGLSKKNNVDQDEANAILLIIDLLGITKEDMKEP